MLFSSSKFIFARQVRLRGFQSLQKMFSYCVCFFLKPTMTSIQFLVHGVWFWNEWTWAEILPALTWSPLWPHVKTVQKPVLSLRPPHLAVYNVSDCLRCSPTQSFPLLSQKCMLRFYFYRNYFLKPLLSTHIFLSWALPHRETWISSFFFLEQKLVGSAHTAARFFSHSSKFVESAVAKVGWGSERTVCHLAEWKNNTLKDRDRHIFLSASKLYPASCLMDEECYLGDKKSACAFRRGLLWGLCQREPRGSPRCFPASVSGGESLDPGDHLPVCLGMGPIGAMFTSSCWDDFFFHVM